MLPGGRYSTLIPQIRCLTKRISGRQRISGQSFDEYLADTFLVPSTCTILFSSCLPTKPIDFCQPLHHSSHMKFHAFIFVKGRYQLGNIL